MPAHTLGNAHAAKQGGTGQHDETARERDSGKGETRKKKKERSLIGPDRRRTLAYGSAYAPTTRTVRMQLAAPAVSSSSVDEVQPASCCWCRCRPAGVTAETTAVDQPLLQAYRPGRGRRAVRACAFVRPVSLCTGETLRPRE